MATNRDASCRLFVAVEIPAALRSSLAALNRALRETCPESACRWVRSESLHLTLKFLGEVASDRLASVREALTAAASSGHRFSLHPVELGTFGSPARVRVVWMGLGGDVEAAVGLARRVDAAMANVGFPAESRPFRPHLTLARVRNAAPPGERRRVAEAVAAFEGPPQERFAVDAVVLMQSFLGPGGARYRVVDRFQLPSVRGRGSR